MAANAAGGPQLADGTHNLPQAVVAPLTRAAIFLVVTVKPGADCRSVIRSFCADLSAIFRAVEFRDLEAALSCIMGIGSEAWDQLFGQPRPAELHPFRELRGGSRHAVSTPGDLLFHIRSKRMDMCFELATQIMARIGEAVSVVDEVHGFRYFDDRDLLGFVDGTENPRGDEVAEAVFIGDADSAFAGGSYVIVQKYLHDMDAWNALSVEEQERVFGRSKLSDIEMPDGVKPANSHVALNTIVDPDGTQRQIVRANMPFGELGRGEFGTYYIAYAATPAVTELMLTHMFIGDPPGNTDRVLDFSTAITGGLFFAPPADFLDDPPEPPGAPGSAQEAGSAGAGSEAGADSGSLNIGSLKRSTRQ